MATKTTQPKTGFELLLEYEKQGTLAHLIMESSDDAIKTKTLDGIISSWNHGAEKIYGYKDIDIIGKNVSILVPPNQPNELVELLKKISIGLHIPHYETKRIRKDGVIIDVSLALSPIKDNKGKIIGVATVSRDITGRTQAAQYARSLIEASLDPLITISPEGKITDVNEATSKITGLTREKLIGTDFSNYFTEPEKAREGYRQVFKQGYVKDYPLTLRSKEGKLIDVLYNATVYKDDAGNVLGVFAAARDITETKQASRYARNLIEANLDPLVTISPEGKITDVNEASIKVTGLTREKLIGTDFSNYFTESDKAREGYQQVFKQGFVKDYPLTLRSKEGRLTDVLYNASVYKDDSGNVLGVFAAARDITETKQASRYARSLIEASLDPLVTISPEGKITDVNEATMQITGLPREKLIGTDFSNYFTEPEKAREGYQQVLKQGYVKDYSLTLKSSDGKFTDVLYNASVYKDTSGTVLGVFAAARDVSAQKKLAEREVAEREKEMQRIAELEKFQKLTVGRELKMIELKKEIEELKKKLGISGE